MPRPPAPAPCDWCGRRRSALRSQSSLTNGSFSARRCETPQDRTRLARTLLSIPCRTPCSCACARRPVKRMLALARPQIKGVLASHQALSSPNPSNRTPEICPFTQVYTPCRYFAPDDLNLEQQRQAHEGSSGAGSGSPRPVGDVARRQRAGARFCAGSCRVESAFVLILAYVHYTAAAPTSTVSDVMSWGSVGGL